MKIQNRSVVEAGFWNLLERIYSQLVRFVINVILARLLFPSDYGIIGMVSVFLAISQSFVEGGFINALIQKQDRTENDFSTAFYFNLVLSVLLYLVLFVIAPLVGQFYNVPDLKVVMRVVSLSIILNALSVVPRSILAIQLDYRKQAKATGAAITISGLLAILFALIGLGVWTLVLQSIIMALLNSIFLIILVNWKPKRVFSYASFSQLFRFGSKLLIVNLFDRVFRNSYLIVIGKIYMPEQLGYYTRAEQFSLLPASNIAGVLQNVTFPKMCEFKDDLYQLKKYYIRNVKFSSFVTFPLLLFLAFFSKPIVMVVLTERWIEITPLLRLLAFLGIMYPINFLQVNLLLSRGLTDLYLKIEFVKKILAVIVLLFTARAGISTIIYGQIIIAVISLTINTVVTSRVIEYRIIDQIVDILKFLSIAFFALIISYFFSTFFHLDLLKLICGFFSTFAIYALVVMITNFQNMRNELRLIFLKNK